jgi:tryptophanyl-tRNA synthetase
MTKEKTVLSGVQPTGRPHLGNFFGAMKQFVELQNSYKTFIFVADYHSLTKQQDPEGLRINTKELVLDYLAIGLDPKKTIIFKQSDVPQVTELSWIFNCITTVPYLMRAHAYKDAEAKGGEVNVGTFSYPLLMAADILLYDADLVPVGQDQKQHVEYARDTALKFNRTFTELFKLPEPLILDTVKVIPGIDGRKMSKSYNNTIPLFSSNDEIKNLVMSIVTDSAGDKPENVYAIHSLFRNSNDLEKIYDENRGKYKNLKEALIADITDFIDPLRKKRQEIAQDEDVVNKVLKHGASIAQEIATKKMLEVKKAIGAN